MRALLFALSLLCVLCTGAKAGTEPFGLKFQEVPDRWAIDLQAKYVRDERAILDFIEAQVRQKPKEHWITWTNQLVNLSPQVYAATRVAACARKAVVKVEVLRRLGFPKEELRLVYGLTPRDEHAVGAVHTPEGWRILDNGAVSVDGHKPQLDSEVRGFLAVRSFYR